MTEYRVTAAEGGTEGAGAAQFFAMEVAVILCVPTNLGGPGGAIIKEVETD